MYRILLLLMVPVLLSAQERINGHVFGMDDDKQEKLRGATVRWSDNTKGSITDLEGYFEIEKPPAGISLIISYVGYKQDTLANPKSHNEIVLISDFTSDEVNVSGRLAQKSVSRSEIFHEETTTRQGLVKAACCNLAESFETNPSVDASFSDAISGAKKISMLGLEGIYTQMLVNRSPNLRGAASTFGLSYIPGGWMESIQVSKGAASVENGFESITGQINVELRSPLDEMPLYIDLFLSEHLRTEANLIGRYGVGESVNSILMAHASFFNREVDNNGDSFLDKPTRQTFNILNAYRVSGSWYEGQITINALSEERKGGQMNFHDGADSLWGFGVDTKRFEAYGNFGVVFDTEHYNSIGSRFSFVHHDQESYFGIRDYDIKHNSLYLALLYETSWGEEFETFSGEHIDEIKFTAGLNYQYDSYDERFLDSAFTHEESVPGVSAQVTYLGLDKFSAILGGRVDEHSVFGTLFTPRFHAKYNFDEYNILRASAGRGYRSPVMLAESMTKLASNRSFNILETPDIEEAWNYGLNFTSEIDLFNLYVILNLEFYRTEFVNQLVVDIDHSAREVRFYNLDGESFSNNFQVEVTIEPITALQFNLAYRLSDVKTTIDGQLREKPLFSRDKLFFNTSYATDYDIWKFDATLVYSGPGRIPSTDENNAEYIRDKDFPGYFQLIGHVTRQFGDNFELYIGGENLLDYKQENPIIAADNASGENFDASLIWGPILGRTVYLGARFYLD